jgi:hypothetical protein
MAPSTEKLKKTNSQKKEKTPKIQYIIFGGTNLNFQK